MADRTTSSSQVEEESSVTVLLELDDVINKVHSVCLDGSTYKQHQQQGTLDHYYRNILTEAVADMATLPVHRNAKGLEPLEDALEVTRTFSHVARLMCLTFGKPYKQVEADLVGVLQQFPTHDYRLAKILRNKNKLH
jgi:hypothetical protein